MPRVFYVAPVSCARLDRRLGFQADVAAARNKVFGVCSALWRANASVFVVSAFVPGAFQAPAYGAEIFREKGIGFVRLFTVGRGALRRAASAFSLLIFAIRFVRADDYVIFYNFFPEYIFISVYLRLRGRSAFLDIEDAPRADDLRLAARITGASFYILRKLCMNRQLIVSENLGRRLNLSRYLPVYGVANYFAQNDESVEKFAGAQINILYGGRIIPEAGSDLVLETIRLLANVSDSPPLHFFITGHFGFVDGLEGEKTAQDFARAIQTSECVQTSVLPHLSMQEYQDVARRMDIGLCLKLASTSIGQTTFPSKVIEIASLGMLLVSTRVSDVPCIFNDENAVLLESEEPRELADALLRAARDRAGSAAKAQKGRELMSERFSSERVGADIMSFLQDD